MYLSVRSAILNGSAPGANTNIISSSLSPVYGGYFVITISLAVASVVNLIITDGSDTETLGLNSSVPLNADDLYTFSVGVAKVDDAGTSLSYNLQVETNGAINYLTVNEVSVGGA